MKFSTLVLCCFITTIHYSTEGGLVKDFFGKVKETAEVVHKDIKEIWRPENGNKDHTQQTITTPVAPSETKDNKDNDKNEEEQKLNHKKENSKVPEDNSSSNTAIERKEDKEDKHEETTTAASSTTTEKDGRANFAGACQTNYRRTSDGRCMPIA